MKKFLIIILILTFFITSCIKPNIQPNLSLSANNISSNEIEINIIGSFENGESSELNITEITELEVETTYSTIEKETQSQISEQYTEPECVHSNVVGNTYHSTSSRLVNYVGMDAFKEWQAEVFKNNKPTDECYAPLVNIYEFVNYFKISREQMDILINTTDLYYTDDIDLDILYTNASIVDEYYRNGQERFDKYYKRSLEKAIKARLDIFVGKEKFEDWIKRKTSEQKVNYYYNLHPDAEILTITSTSKKGEKVYNTNEYSNNYRLWSIAEIVNEFNISREDFEKVLLEMNPNGEYLNKVNLDVLYENKENYREMISNNIDPAQLDALIHK